MNPILKLFKLQRAVVHGGGKTEAVVHQVLLATAVPMPHPVDLRDGRVALVDKQEKVAGKIVQQRRWGFTREPTGKMPGIVLNPVTVAH
jgi:hypothetical protein